MEEAPQVGAPSIQSRVGGFLLGLLAQGDTQGVGHPLAILKSRKVEAIQVHHLVPGRHEVIDKLLLRVQASVDFSQGAELGV